MISAHDPATSIFIALWPEGDAWQQLARLTRSLAAKVGGKAIRMNNLHLTLVYIGRVDVDTVMKLRELIAAVKQPTFCLELDELCFWKRNGMMIATTRNCPAQLTSLAQNLRQTLTAASIAYDQHVFKPHVTLVRRARTVDLPALTDSIAWTATGMSLVQSLQTLNGSVYRSLADCRFMKRGADMLY